MPVNVNVTTLPHKLMLLSRETPPTPPSILVPHVAGTGIAIILGILLADDADLFWVE